jgi:hypothetical protein
LRRTFRETHENELQVLAGNRQIKIPIGNDESGTDYVPLTLYLRPAYVAAFFAAYVDFTERHESLSLYPF